MKKKRPDWDESDSEEEVKDEIDARMADRDRTKGGKRVAVKSLDVVNTDIIIVFWFDLPGHWRSCDAYTITNIIVGMHVIRLERPVYVSYRSWLDRIDSNVVVNR